MGSAGFAGLLGLLLVSNSVIAPNQSAAPSTIVGAQSVTTDSKEEPHRVIRMRAPLRDFFGLFPAEQAYYGSKTDSSEVKLDDENGNKGETRSGEKTPADKSDQVKATGVTLAKGDPWTIEEDLLQSLDGYQLSFLVMTVADPIDSVENYNFDHAIDATLKALAADPSDRWLYCTSYLPWQVFKDRRAVEPKMPLLRQAHWYQDEPGVMIFRKVPQAESDPKPDQKQELLLIYLVGELPTFGVQRDALDHSFHDIAILSRWDLKQFDPNDDSLGREIRIIGPCFTGGAFSMREALRVAKVRYGVRAQIVSPSATAIDPGTFDGDSFIGATVCHWRDAANAINDFINKSQIDKSKQNKCAWLVETGTGFSSGFESKNSSSGELNHQYVFHYPAGVSRVRGGFEKQITAARQQAKGLQALRSTSALPFDAEESTRDFPAIQTPAMTSPSVELMLDHILRSINDQGIPFVAIMATDVRDTIFLSELIKLRCPHVQLFIPEPDILMTHPEYTDSLRGAIVASSYPLFPGGLSLHLQHEHEQTMTILSGQSVYGVFNAVLVQRHLARATCVRDLATLRFSGEIQEFKQKYQRYFVGLFQDQEKLSPRIWLHTIGYDRFHLLKLVPQATKDSEYAISISHKGITKIDSLKINSSFLAWSPLIVASTVLLLILSGLLLKSSFSLLKQVFSPKTKDPAIKPDGSARRHPRGQIGILHQSWSALMDNGMLKPLVQFSEASKRIRHAILMGMMITIAITNLFLVAFSISVLTHSCSLRYAGWLTESYIFSGVSLLLPLVLAGAAIVCMCYMKLRQSYLVSEGKLIGIPGVTKHLEFGSLWWAMGNPLLNPAPLLWLTMICVPVVIWMFCSTWSTSYEVSGRPCLFWTTWAGIVIGYAIWWLAAAELLVFQRQLRDQPSVAIKWQHWKRWKQVFEEMQKKRNPEDSHSNSDPLKGVYRLLFGPGPGNRDQVSDLVALYHGKTIEQEALHFFRGIQYRMVMIKNQFYLLVLGAILLFLAVVSYPFTCGGIFNTLATWTILTLVIGVCLCFWKLESDRDLSGVLGTTANQLTWDWNTISFFGRNVFLAILVLTVQFVPGTWMWLGNMLGPLSHFGH